MFFSKQPEIIPKSGIESLLDWIEDCSKHPEMWEPASHNWREVPYQDDQNAELGEIIGVVCNNSTREDGFLHPGEMEITLAKDGELRLWFTHPTWQDNDGVAYDALYVPSITEGQRDRVKLACENILAAKAIQLLITKYSALTEQNPDAEA